jgi:hypothetical protein
MEEFSSDSYPPFCYGPIIFYSSNAVRNFYHGVQKLKYFWIDDVQITGIVRKVVNIKIEQLDEFSLSEEMENKTLSGEIKDHKFLVGRQDFTVDQMRKLWMVLKKRTKNLSNL